MSGVRIPPLKRNSLRASGRLGDVGRWRRLRLQAGP